MKKHECFEWDKRKDRSNARKHGVTFDDAAAVLADPMYELFHSERFDIDHSDTEERYITVGTDPMNRSSVIVVVWTDRSQTTRIISARPATPIERKEYEAEIQARQDRPQIG